MYLSRAPSLISLQSISSSKTGRIQGDPPIASDIRIRCPALLPYSHSRLKHLTPVLLAQIDQAYFVVGYTDVLRNGLDIPPLLLPRAGREVRLA
jgi:hypothetical protein